MAKKKLTTLDTLRVGKGKPSITRTKYPKNYTKAQQEAERKKVVRLFKAKEKAINKAIDDAVKKLRKIKAKKK